MFFFIAFVFFFSFLQLEASTNKELNQEIPLFNLPFEILCRVICIHLLILCFISQFPCKSMVRNLLYFLIQGKLIFVEMRVCFNLQAEYTNEVYAQITLHRELDVGNMLFCLNYCFIATYSLWLLRRKNRKSNQEHKYCEYFDIFYCFLSTCSSFGWYYIKVNLQVMIHALNL